MRNFYRLLLVFLILAAMPIKDAMAVSAYPEPVKYKQPDGSVITIIMQGDERVKWAQTTDGYTILTNKEGYYEYATLDSKGDLVRSGIRVNEASKRSMAEKSFVAGVSKGLLFSESQVTLMKGMWEMGVKESQKAFPTTGNRKLVCILVGFKDKAFTKTQAEVNNLFNQVGYSTGGATGSVKDYYNENSYGQFNLTVDVFGPYTASQNMSYYGANDASGNDVRPRELVTEAINMADGSANFANYDNDGDGSVDGVYVIYAGYGEEAGGGTNCIWAHAWSIPTLTKDGKYISKYSCSAELRGNSGSTLTAIGVICHEFGHVLGAPDYYDTNYATGGEFQGTGTWDMMASGSWNNNGVTPAHHNAFTKCMIYGWATPTTLTSATNVTLNNAAEYSNSFYRINTTTSGEYYIIENREKHKFDAYVPGSGMMIYHVHSGVMSAASSNNINATYPQKMYPVCASATTNPGSTSSTYGSINSAGCPWPGTSNKTSFTDATTPNMKSWAGANTGKPITNIARNATAKTVSFSFMGGGTTNPPSTPSGLSTSAITSSSATLSWSAATGATSYNVQVRPQGGSWSTFSSSTTSYSLSGLSSATTYEWQVRATNSAGSSSYSSYISFTTTTVVATYCTSKGNTYSDEWISSVVVGSFSNSSAAAGYTDFTSKTITMEVGKAYSVTLTPGFGGSSYSEGWRVWVDLNNDKDFDDAGELVLAPSATSKTAVTGTITIPAGTSVGATRMRVSMKYNGFPTACETFSYGEVEDYTVSIVAGQVTPPATPTGLATSSITTSSATLSWSASTGATSYSVQVRPQGGSWSTYSTSSTSYSLSGLAAATTYEWQVRANNANGSSSYATAISFTTQSVSLTYCTSKGSNSSYEWIDLVQFAGIDRTSGNDGGYKNMTSMVASVAPGGSYTIYFSAGFKSSSYTEYWAVWIDFNQNGTFDADEKVVSGSSSSSATLSATVAIPSTALLGNTRMRVSMKYNAAQTACETFSYGEVEDYTVNISNSAPAVDNTTFAENLNDKAVEVYTIYPNPVSDLLNVSLNGIEGEVSLRIYDLQGRLVKETMLNNFDTQINVEDLAKGVYIISVDEEKMPINKRFIKM